MAHPFPALKVYPQSTLTFAWAEFNGAGVTGTFDASLGVDGASVSMVMVIAWGDLQTACTQIIGYSYRDNLVLTPNGHPYLRRLTPWQHPYFNQLYVKRIAKIQGVRLEGNSANNPDVVFELNPQGGGAGPLQNIGPYSQYNLALLTINFWRPPYAIREDADILDSGDNPQEWLRWVDRNWEVHTQMLCRENMTYSFLDLTTTPAYSQGISAQPFQAPLGQKIIKTKLKRKWYEVPEACLFTKNVDKTPSGLPYYMMYTQRLVVNPITGFIYNSGNPIAGCVNGPIAGVFATPPQLGHCTIGTPQITNLTNTAGIVPGGPVGSDNPGTFVDGAGRTSTVKTIDSPTQVTMNDNATITDVSGNRMFVFENPAGMFWGCFAGTLLLEAIEITPRPLQLPSGLMRIPGFNNGEPISQNQYDVTFHFELFDPPRAPGGSAFRGHNLAPYSGDGMWYVILCQSVLPTPGGTPLKTTIFQYADFTDLFKVL